MHRLAVERERADADRAPAHHAIGLGLRQHAVAAQVRRAGELGADDGEVQVRQRGRELGEHVEPAPVVLGIADQHQRRPRGALRAQGGRRARQARVGDHDRSLRAGRRARALQLARHEHHSVAVRDLQRARAQPVGAPQRLMDLAREVAVDLEHERHVAQQLPQPRRRRQPAAVDQVDAEPRARRREHRRIQQPERDLPGDALGQTARRGRRRPAQARRHVAEPAGLRAARGRQPHRVAAPFPLRPDQHDLLRGAGGGFQAIGDEQQTHATRNLTQQVRRVNARRVRPARSRPALRRDRSCASTARGSARRATRAAHARRPSRASCTD